MTRLQSVLKKVRVPDWKDLIMALIVMSGGLLRPERGAVQQCLRPVNAATASWKLRTYSS